MTEYKSLNVIDNQDYYNKVNGYEALIRHYSDLRNALIADGGSAASKNVKNFNEKILKLIKEYEEFLGIGKANDEESN